jgi:hypothetical protein
MGRTIVPEHFAVTKDSSIKQGAMPIRYKSELTFLEIPVLSIAVGPDPAHREFMPVV